MRWGLLTLTTVVGFFGCAALASPAGAERVYHTVPRLEHLLPTHDGTARAIYQYDGALPVELCVERAGDSACATAGPSQVQNLGRGRRMIRFEPRAGSYYLRSGVWRDESQPFAVPEPDALGIFAGCLLLWGLRRCVG